jgi:hypothetical protein
MLMAPAQRNRIRNRRGRFVRMDVPEDHSAFLVTQGKLTTENPLGQTFLSAMSAVSFSADRNVCPPVGRIAVYDTFDDIRASAEECGEPFSIEGSFINAERNLFRSRHR